MILVQLRSLSQITLCMTLVAQAIEAKSQHILAVYLVGEIQITFPNLEVRQ